MRKRAEEIVDMMEKLESEFQSMEETVRGDVYIGGGETDAMKQIAHLVRNIQAHFPEIRYHLYSGNEDDVTERLDGSPISLLYGVFHIFQIPITDIMECL